ncbi:MAG: STAS-like domain-containing protein [Hormoscilla sp.]
MKYNIRDLIGENCLTIQDGQKVYDLIHPELLSDRTVELNFLGVKRIFAPFLNFAIGQLYQDLQPEDLHRLLKVSHMNTIGMQGLKIVTENMQRYYGDRQYREAVNAVMLAKSQAAY